MSFPCTVCNRSFQSARGFSQHLGYPKYVACKQHHSQTQAQPHRPGRLPTFRQPLSLAQTEDSDDPQPDDSDQDQDSFQDQDQDDDNENDPDPYQEDESRMIPMQSVQFARRSPDGSGIDGVDVSILKDFTSYVHHAQQHFCDLSSEETAAVHLLTLMRKNRSPLKSFDSLQKWRKQYTLEPRNPPP